MKILITISVLLIFNGMLTAQQNNFSTESESPPNDSVSIIETYEVTMPHYPGGDIEFFKYLLMNQRYPSDAKNLDIDGNVTVSFVILKNGSVNKNSVKVVSSPSKLLNKEAIRLITNSPKWVPATKSKEGKKPFSIDYEITFPVPFRIK